MVLGRNEQRDTFKIIIAINFLKLLMYLQAKQASIVIKINSRDCISRALKSRV